MPTAIISDIHANAEALRAVLADIDSRGVERLICLGDIVGYGPDPLECLDMVRRRCEWSLLGNHDYAVLYEPTNFNAAAETSAFWTRDRFDAEADEALKTERYDFLGHLRVRIVDKTPGGDTTVLAVHGSPRRPINEYIFDTDPRNAPEKMESIFERVERLAIVGHTHVPGVFTDEPDFYPPEELGESTYKFLDDEKAIINVGSVGQPRDGDARASYALLHDDRVEFVRVAYDAEKTAQRIREISQLDPWLGERLLEGK